MNTNKKNIKVLFTGGGTAGSVVPLLAILDKMRKLDTENPISFLWVGTRDGIEKEMVKHENIDFFAITSGKLRRYFSWQNFVDLFKIAYAFLESISLLVKQKPNIVISAGSFVSVPLVWAAYLLGIPVMIHQMDVRAGLANKLMAPFARRVTTTFEKSLKDYGKKAVCVGNPIRNKLSDFSMTHREAYQKLGLSSNLPIVLVMGGGTGASSINDIIWDNLDKLLTFCQIIHITGKGKMKPEFHEYNNSKYHSFEFLDINGMLKVFTVSDLVVSRCGMGVLTELSKLGKASILIPMPDSHQEDNAQIFAEKEAAIVVNEKELGKQNFVKLLENNLKDEEKKETLRENIRGVIQTDAADRIMGEIFKIVK